MALTNFLGTETDLYKHPDSSVSVLYVDDEKSLLESGKRYLESSGPITVDTLTSAEEALALPHLHTYDAIVSDYLMPDMDGLVLLQEIRERFDIMPFILVSEKGREEVIIRAIEYGVDFYIQKGEDSRALFEEISDKLMKAVQRRRVFSDQIPAVEKEIRGQYAELKTLKNSLEESEKKFRNIVETSPDVIWDTDLDGFVTYVSPQCCSISGYTPEELVGRNLLSILTPEGMEMMREVLKEGKTRKPGLFSFDVPVLHKDGSQRILNIRSFPLEDKSGNRVGFRGVSSDVTELFGMMKELRASEERFRLMAERSSDLIVILDDRLCATYISPSVFAITGYLQQELVGKSTEDAASLLFPMDIEEFKHIIRTLQEKESVEDVNIRILTKDGRSVFVNLYATPIVNNNLLTGAQVSMRVITSVKEIKAALYKSEEKYRVLAENVHDVIWTCDETMHLTYISPSVTRALGFTQEQALKMKLEDFLAPESMQVFQTFLEQGQDLLKNGIPVPHKMVLELEFKTKNKPSTWAEMMISTAFDANKKFTGFVGVTRDITKRKEAEELLRKSEEKFRSFVENANDIVFSLTPDGIITYIPDKWTTIFGYENNEVIGCDASRFIHPDDYPRIFASITQKIIEGKEKAVVECRLLYKDGSWKWHSLNISPVLDEEGNVILLQGISHDINERKRNEDAIKKANRQLSLLTGITRHDILNKVSVIYGFLELMEKGLLDPSTTEYFSIICNATRDIQTQIEFTRIYEELGSHEPQWILLDLVIPRSQVPSSVTLNTDIQGIIIFADPMLEKVFFNLLDNSLRHGETVSEIRVSARKEGDFLIVVWEDNGVGIADNEKEKIFERGFGKNTSLGMFLVREILSLTDIRITENGKPGTGARFEMKIPRESYRAILNNVT
ncbi:PAS domain S-box protein [Methanospirillum sp.]